MEVEKMTNMDYEKLLDLEPQNLNHLRQYTIFSLKTKSYKKAHELLLKILDIDPNDIVAHNNYALLLTYEIKDYKQAEMHYQKALELDANNLSANKNYQNFLKLKIGKSEYYQRIQQLSFLVKGKIVADSIVGNSGFILILDDNSSVVSFLDDDKLFYKYIENEVSQKDRDLIYSNHYGDGKSPLNIDIPYANQICDLASEIANAHNQPITGLSIGENAFNFCFPNGKELETMIVPDKDRKITLRVFWEQW